MTPRSAARLVPLAALALLLAAPAAAQFVPAAAPPAEAPAAPPDEGIHVHGAWTITVSDPDGSVAGRYEFQNALTEEGAFDLVTLLRGGQVVDRWAIDLFGEDISRQNIRIDPATVARERTSPPSGDGVIVLAVSGSSPASSAFPIKEVITRIDYSSASGGFAAFNQPFTAKVLDTPIPVEAGQTVDVRVEISFE